MNALSTTPHPDETTTSDETQRWLVVGDDRTEAAEELWGWLAAQPWDGWRATALTALPHDSGVPGDLAIPREWTPDPPRSLPGVEVEHIQADVDPRVLIDAYDDADLVVIGPRGHGLFKRLGLGSTAEWLVSAHRPLAPVLIARGDQPVRTILVCADGSPDALDAVRTLGELPLAHDAEITVLGVDTMQGESRDAVVEAANELRGAGADQVHTLLVGAVPMTVTFDVKPTILGTIDKTEPDLVVVGTRGLGGFKRAMLGSTAESVVHHARCSVLIGRAADRG